MLSFFYFVFPLKYTFEVRFICPQVILNIWIYATQRDIVQRLFLLRTDATNRKNAISSDSLSEILLFWKHYFVAITHEVWRLLEPTHPPCCHNHLWHRNLSSWMGIHRRLSTNAKRRLEASAAKCCTWDWQFNYCDWESQLDGYVTIGRMQQYLWYPAKRGQFRFSKSDYGASVWIYRCLD